MDISGARKINQAGNDAIEYTDDIEAYGKPDWWETAKKMVVDPRAGKILDDCDGYAVWKYERMKEAGTSLDQLALLICIYLPTGEGHMVLCWYEDASDPWVLDNIDRVVWKASDRSDLMPIVAFNEKKMWNV